MNGDTGRAPGFLEKVKKRLNSICNMLSLCSLYRQKCNQALCCMFDININITKAFPWVLSPQKLRHSQQVTERSPASAHAWRGEADTQAGVFPGWALVASPGVAPAASVLCQRSELTSYVLPPGLTANAQHSWRRACPPAQLSVYWVQTKLVRYGP